MNRTVLDYKYQAFRLALYTSRPLGLACLSPSLGSGTGRNERKLAVDPSPPALSAGLFAINHFIELAKSCAEASLVTSFSVCAV